MPSAITHYLLAKKVKEQIKPRLYDDAFFCGAQGPDVLLLSRKLPLMLGKSIAEAGVDLHKENPKKLFAMIGDYFSRYNNDIIKSYIIGFICHYALDSVCHPYIYSMVEDYRKTLNLPEKITDSTLHAKVETMLDVIILRTLENKEPTRLSLTKTFPVDPHMRSAVSAMYEYLISAENTGMSGGRLRSKVEQSFRDTRKVFKTLNNTLLYKTWLAGAAEKILKKPMKYTSYIRPIMEDDDFDYSNSANQEWNNVITGAVSNQSFEDLFMLSSIRAVELVEAFLDGSIELVVGNVNFLGRLADIPKEKAAADSSMV